MTPDDFNTCVNLAGTRAMIQEAAKLRAELCADRGLPPSSGCRPAMSVREPVRAGLYEHLGECWCDSEGGEL